MKDSDRKRLDMFIRIRQFGAAHTADFPPHTAAADYLVEINTIIDQVRESIAVQASGEIGRGTIRKAALRDAIRARMKDIARTARALSLNNTGLDDLFRIPDKNNDLLLLSAARQFVKAAGNFQADFIRFGLNADFTARGCSKG